MRLKSFATYGFKSFAEKTELTFDNGITAIVGPNGSGKSNISDAVRWVLGEQSVKYLRGGKMEDVIFSGTSKRRPLGVAEVTLNFDNHDGALAVDFAEVSLTRRLFRSGESEYAINKKSCRLKDIIDLMADTGLGKGSMSIIGQNKIDEILNSRPEERRALFEEAAGIAKYRLRKKDAVRKLDETALNLTRINDIRTEVENQVEPLRIAAEKTERYNQLAEQLRKCKITGYIHKLDDVAAACKLLAEKKAAAEEKLAACLAVLSSHEAEHAQIQAEIDSIGEQFARLLDEIKSKETALEKIKGHQAVLDERIENSKRTMARLQTANTRLAGQAEELESKMSALAAEFDATDKKRAAAELSVNRLNSEKSQKEAEAEAFKMQSDKLQSEIFADMQELLTLRNNLRNLEKEQENRVKRRDVLKSSIEEAELLLNSLAAQYAELSDKEARSIHEQSFIQKEIDEENSKNLQLKKELQETKAQQGHIQNKISTVENRLQFLQKMQSNYEGFGYGIKAVLKSREAWSSKIVGVAAELIKVEPKLVTAIETALGEAAQNIVTADAETAKAAIAYLKKNAAGRATFLPLDNLKDRTPSHEEQRLASLPGVCGFAYDLVESAPEAAKAIRFLLGRVLIAENIDAALKAARASGFRVRTVTLDGDVVNAGGSMTGGSRKQKEGYLSRVKEIELLEAQLKVLRGEMLRLQEQTEELERKDNASANKLKLSNAKLQEMNRTLNSLSLELQKKEQEKSSWNDKLNVLLDEKAYIADEYMKNRDQVKALRQAVADSEAKDSSAKQMLEDMQKQMAAYKSMLAAVENQLQDAKIVLETSANKADMIAERIKGLDNDTLAVRNEIKQNEQELQHLEAGIEQSTAEKMELGRDAENILQQLQATELNKEQFKENRLVLLNRLQQSEAVIAEAKADTAVEDKQLKQLDIDLTRQSSDREHILQILSEDYSLDEESARKGELLQADQKALKKLEAELTADIALLGPINSAAVEEFEAVHARAIFLNKQYTDLCTAKEHLESVISEINSGMVKKFKEAFAQINQYFGSCYKKLFGGGTALLKLSDPEDILNSGIDIDVQPPGKHLQSLFLLSGGERALTVIALLFALLSYQPAPFCILDEIDAALDDANIVRFSRFLKEYASDTQFIIITHRKGTMECADVMYGVTMEESGVSKLLSVKLEEKE